MLNVPTTRNPSHFNVYVDQASLEMDTIVQVSHYTISQCNNHKTLGPEIIMKEAYLSMQFLILP